MVAKMVIRVVHKPGEHHPAPQLMQIGHGIGAVGGDEFGDLKVGVLLSVGRGTFR